MSQTRLRWERPWRFLKNRLTPGGYLGLHLTVGLLIVLAGTIGFLEIAERLGAGSAMVTRDLQVSQWMQDHRTPGRTRWARVLTELGSGWFVGAVALGAGIWLYRRRRWHRGLALALSVGGGAVVNALLKLYYQRARPIFAQPLLTLDSYSFPSGHMMGATLLYGALALSVLLFARGWRWWSRLLALLGAVLLIGVVGVTRIYLGAHYLSDVLGATAVGVAWLMATHTGVEIFRLRKIERELAELDQKTE